MPSWYLFWRSDICVFNDSASWVLVYDKQCIEQNVLLILIIMKLNNFVFFLFFFTFISWINNKHSQFIVLLWWWANIQSAKIVYFIEASWKVPFPTSFNHILQSQQILIQKKHNKIITKNYYLKIPFLILPWLRSLL